MRSAADRALWLFGCVWLGACGREVEAPPRDAADAVAAEIDSVAATDSVEDLDDEDADTVGAADDHGADTVPALDEVAADTSAGFDDASADTADVRDALADGADDASGLAVCEVVASARVPIPEASGAALMDAGGTRVLLVADSGNMGRALIIDLQSGQSIAAVLPLGEGAGDDVEGLERAPDGRIFGLTSAGYLRAWRADGDGFALVLGPVAVSDDPAWVCEPFGVNCAANYEGLCLHPSPAPGACAGWAASKATGELVCLVAEGDGYRVDGARRVAVTAPDRLSGCAYEPVPPFRLIAAGNLYSASAIWELDPSGAVVELPERGAGNQEAILFLSGGRLRSYGDAQDFLEDESPALALECR